MSLRQGMDYDFGEEFPPVKELASEELKKDRLIKRLKLQRKIEKLEQQESEAGAEKDSPTESDLILAEEEEPRRKFRRKGSDTKKKGLREGRRNINKIQLVNSSTSNTRKTEDETEISGEDTDFSTGSGVSRSEGENHGVENEKFLEEDQKARSEKIKKLKLINFGENQPAKGSENKLREIGTPELGKDNNFGGNSPVKEDVELVKRQVKAQISGRAANFSNFMMSPQLSSKYREIFNMFENTIKDNEGHSALVIGPRASGKTTIIHHSLQELGKKYPGQFITINLNAYIHSDDTIAIREIARQLDYNAKRIREDYVKFHDNFEQRSISDTFSNLLSTLDKNFSESLENEHGKAVSIIFIIDEFEKFTAGHKQTLLYNLFDLCQNSKTPICVVGVSTRITSREFLEKRVRSRFSQRLILLNKVSTIDDFWANAKLGLILGKQVIAKLRDEKYGKLWNDHIESLFNTPSSNVRKLVFQNFHTVKNYKEFNNNCIVAVSNLSPNSSPFLQDSNFAKYALNQTQNSIQSSIGALSELESLLLIAAARWIEKSEVQVVNFQLACNEYTNMIKAFNDTSMSSNASSIVTNSIMSNLKISQKIWSPKVLRNCWESLYRLGLLLDYGAVTTNSEGQIIATSNSNKNIIIEESKMVQLDVTLDELGLLMSNLNLFKALTKL